MPLRGRFMPNVLLPRFHQLDALEKKPGFHTLEKNSVFYLILSELQSFYKDSEDISASAKIATYLATHYTEPVSIAQVAKHLNYSTDYMIRVFHRSYGMTPYQYTIDLRINHAKKLLTSTGYPIYRIAQESGFCDESAFYRAFTKKNKISPSLWQKTEIMG